MVNHRRMTLSDPLSLIPNISSIAKNSLQDSFVQPGAYLNKRYYVLDLIGQGGFGKTFLAIEESHSVRSPCVIKQLFFTHQNTDLQQKTVEQFYQEALQLCELGSHSRIPQLLDFFEQDGYFYLVQEWIDGQNLEQELFESSPFNEAEIRQMLFELLPILQFIHDHQVIHRDIKPANIIRRRSDQQLVLVDFGAAKCLTATELALIKSSDRLSPRLAAAAATPPLQKAISDEEEMAEISDCLNWIWRIATLTAITSLAVMILIIIITTVESKFSTTAPKVENVQPVQGVNSLGQR